MYYLVGQNVSLKLTSQVKGLLSYKDDYDNITSTRYKCFLGAFVAQYDESGNIWEGK